MGFILSCRGNIIRIHHECEGGIDKSVLRITDCHHEACRVMTNGDCEGQILLSHPHTNNGLFSCSPLSTAFYIGKHEKVFQKILNSLRCDMVMSFKHCNDAKDRRIDVRHACD